MKDYVFGLDKSAQSVGIEHAPQHSYSSYEDLKYSLPPQKKLRRLSKQEKTNICLDFLPNTICSECDSAPSVQDAVDLMSEFQVV